MPEEQELGRLCKIVELLSCVWNQQSIASVAHSNRQLQRVEDDALRASGCYNFIEELEGKCQLISKSQ
jgi:hypothetical protein